MVMLTAMCDVVDDADDSDNDGDGDDGDGDNAEILMMVIIFVAASEVKRNRAGAISSLVRVRTNSLAVHFVSLTC